METITMTVRPFRMGTDKEVALKPLEEAAEVYGAWQDADWCGSPSPTCGRSEVAGVCDAYAALADELADCVTACVNLADRYGIDLQAALDRVESHNRERGRY